MHRQLNFKVDERTETMVIQVIDADTEEVVRQIPSEGILQLQQRLAEIQESGGKADASVMDGLLVNTTA
jgi:flagellar protein FlaG